jgi:hypothetical protein
MRRKLLPFGAAGLAVLALVGCNKGTEGVTVFAAQLSGANEVPARSTFASGAGGFNLEGGTVTYSIEVHGLPNVTGAHIHSGAAGTNGPIRVNFITVPLTSPVSADDGVLIEGSFTAANVTVITFDQLIEQMRTGNAYLNVHSPTYPGGEIRGQIQVVQQE